MSTEKLENKTLVMMVGPSAIGKSSLMNEMVGQHNDFAYVEAFTTRQPRPGERSHYTFISQERARELHETGAAITYIEHPTTKDMYGTTIESYPKKYNLLDTLSGSVAQYRALPFERTLTLAVTAPFDEWRSWFLGRYPEPSPEAEKRLREAILSIEWSLHDTEVYWINNREGALREVAREAIAATLQLPLKKTVPDEPRIMLEQIKKGLWR